MIVNCQKPGCTAALWIDGATFAIEHTVICFSCLAEKAFPNSSTKAAAMASPSTPTPPSNGAAWPPTEEERNRALDQRREEVIRHATHIACPGIGEPGDVFYVPGHDALWHLTERGPWPGALCSSCYAITQKMKAALR